MNLDNPIVRYVLIAAVAGTAFVLCHLIDHGGTVAR